VKIQPFGRLLILVMCRTLCLQYGAKLFTSHYCVGDQSRAAVMDAATIAKPLLSEIPDLAFQLRINVPTREDNLAACVCDGVEVACHKVFILETSPVLHYYVR
jgi:hypothetical protein